MTEIKDRACAVSRVPYLRFSIDYEILVLESYKGGWQTFIGLFLRHVSCCLPIARILVMSGHVCDCG
jgi:hypothetical protein